jgi:hypothetical protein
VQVFDVVDATTPIASDGPPVPVDLLTPGQNARLPFTGTSGRRMSVLVNVASGGFGCVWYTEIRRKDNSALIGTSQGSCASTSFREPIALPAEGEYVVVVNPVGVSTGSAAVHLYDVVDVDTTISPGAPAIAVDLSIPGRNTRLPFSGVEGQNMSVWVTVTGGSLGCPWKTEIRRLDNDALVGSSFSSCGSVGFLDPVTLPVTGSYVVVVDPVAGAAGTATVQLFSVVDVTGTVFPDGPAVSFDMSTPGQKTQLTFSATNGQRVSASIPFTSGNIGGMTNCYWVRILKPDNTPVTSDRTACATSTFFEPWTLPTSGTHTFVIDPQSYFTGGGTVSLYNVPPDVTGTLSVNGDPLPVSLAAPGQNAHLTFVATQGQSVTVRLTGNSISGGTNEFPYVSLIRPNGTVQVSGASLSPSFNLTPQTLVAGTYTVRVDPNGTATGAISVQVTSP